MDSWMDGALLLLLRRLVACETRDVEILLFVVVYKNDEDFAERRNPKEGRGRMVGTTLISKTVGSRPSMSTSLA